MRKKQPTKSTTKNTAKGKKFQTSPAKKNSSKFGSNDPAWYAVDPVILNDAASMPYSFPTGMPFNTSGRTEVTGGRSFRNPGIMAFHLAPTIGTSVSPSDPVNIAATQSYAFIRHGNSGSVNYDAGDIMLYYLAMADVYSYIEYLKRIYGTAALYAQRNRYVPLTLLYAQHVDPFSVINNLANFRLGINMLINKAASFAVPTTMSLFNRRRMLYTAVYTEGNSIKDQLYMYVPAGFGVYKWQDSKIAYMDLNAMKVESVLGLTCDSYDAQHETFSAMDLLKIGHAMIDVIINNEDLGTMNGDILKVYGDNILKLEHLPEDYLVIPVKDEYVLEQMQNASIIPRNQVYGFDIISTYANEDATEGVSILQSQPTIQSVSTIPATWSSGAVVTAEGVANMVPLAGKRVIATTLDAPAPADTMEITRLAAVIQKNDVAYSLSCGTEVVVQVEAFTKPYEATSEARGQLKVDLVNGCLDIIEDKNIKSAFGGSNSDLDYNICKTLMKPYVDRAKVGAFSYAPAMSSYASESLMTNRLELFNDLTKAGNATTISFATGNFTLFTPDELEKLHLVAIMNEFATPHVALR